MKKKRRQRRPWNFAAIERATQQMRPAVALQPAIAPYTTTLVEAPTEWTGQPPPPFTSLVAENLPPCPFCGAVVALDVAHGGVIHGLPMCDRFRRLSPVDFLTAMRIALEGN